MSDRTPALHLAIDLGAGSGRAILGRAGAGDLLLREVHRFEHAARRIADHVRWDFEAIIDGVREAVARAGREAAFIGAPLTSIGVDAWGVDYGLIDDDGELIEDPVCYRDERTAGMMEDVFALVPREEIFARTGIQFLPFNTLFQLAAHARQGFPARAARLLMIPDLCHLALCGAAVGERTNASTTQMVRLSDGRWDADLMERVGLPRSLMPAIVSPGTTLGRLLPRHQSDLGAPAIAVIAPATHDTASAVAGTPLEPGWAYISSGTWSLVGVERNAPLVGHAAAAANFTNEAGYSGCVRFLKNVMGLWILEGCRREWEASGTAFDRGTLLDRVAAVRGCAGVVYPDHPGFLNPPSMIGALRARLAESGQRAHDDPVLLARVVLDSLALRYASVLTAIETLTGETIPGIHIVGGGSRNAYLNQATADASGRTVLAGPVEATAAGNVLVQAIACGEIPSLDEGRRLLSRSIAAQRFLPRRPAEWAEAARRYEEIEAACHA